MTLADAGSMLIYHNDIRTDTTIDVISEMKRRRGQGDQIFFDIYSEQEKRKDPEKRDTGLFYFSGKPNAPFAIICAGGGFYYVGSIHESLPHALEISRRGCHGFALVYRTRTADAACEDLARAICFIFDHAKELGICTEGYSLWGGSAGARMEWLLILDLSVQKDSEKRGFPERRPWSCSIQGIANTQGKIQPHMPVWEAGMGLLTGV